LFGHEVGLSRTLISRGIYEEALFSRDTMCSILDSSVRTSD
jgi:hypothetical protein